MNHRLMEPDQQRKDALELELREKADCNCMSSERDCDDLDSVPRPERRQLGPLRYDLHQ